jgi:hypothetical protein
MTRTKLSVERRVLKRGQLKWRAEEEPAEGVLLQAGVCN